MQSSPDPAQAQAGRRRAAVFAASGVLLAAVAAILAALAQPLLAGRLYASFDLRTVVIPDRLFYSLCLERGELGLWSPFLARGLDHIGYWETGLFHPVRLLLYGLLSAPTALAVELLLPFPVLLAGGWLGLRRVFGCTGLAAGFGAALLAFGVFPLAHFGQTHMVLIFAHLPWLVLAAAGTLAGRRPALAAAGFGALVASLLLLCQPQAACLTLLPAAWLVGYRLAAGPRPRPSWRRTLWLALAAAGGLAVGMLQLGPTLAALRDSPRGALGAAERCNFSLAPVHLAVNLCPRLFGAGEAPDLRQAGAAAQPPAPRWANGWTAVGDVVRQPGCPPVFVANPSEFAAYFGVGLLTLLWGCWMLGAAGQVRPRTGLWVGVGVVVLVLLMLGGYGGLHLLLERVPLVAQFRAPNRYKLVLGALLCLGGALGLHALERGTLRRPGWGTATLLLLPALAAAAGLGYLAWRGGLVVGPQPLPAPDLAAWLVGPGVAAVTAVLLWLAARGWRAAFALLPAVVVLDPAVALLPIVRDVPTRSFAEVAAARRSLAPRDRPFRDVALTNDPLWTGTYLATSYLGMTAPESLSFADARHLQLASVAAGWPTPDHRQPLALPPLPRFRLVPGLRPAEPGVAAAEWPDPTAVALCPPGVAPLLAGPPLRPGEGVVAVAEHAATIRIHVRAEATRLLVNSDRWAPGWRATVDGQPAAVLPLYAGALRGVLVPAGSREVVLRYRPPGWPGYLVLAGSGTALLLGLALLGASRPPAGAPARAPDYAPSASPATPPAGGTTA